MFQQSTLQWNIPGAASQTTERHGIKRKNLITPDTILPPPPEKHFVTEDEMTAEMRRLQIMEPGASNMFPINTPFTVIQPNDVSPPWSAQKTSPNTYFQVPTSQACNQPFLFNSEGQFSGFGSNNNTAFDKEMESDDLKKNDLPRLFISGDVYKVEPAPILPHTIIDSIPNRNLALVPWVPPILPVLEDETDSKKYDNEMDM